MLQESATEGHSKRHFQPGDRVMSRNFTPGSKWLPGTIIKHDSTTLVQVKLDDGRVWRRYIDHVRESQVTTSMRYEHLPYESLFIPCETGPLTMPELEVGQESILDSETDALESPNLENDNHSEEQSQTNQESKELRRSSCARKPPDRLKWVPISSPRGGGELWYIIEFCTHYDLCV